MKGILGIKLGMTEVFEKNGNLVPVTVIKVEANVVTQLKTKDNDGYEAIQLGFDTKREKLSNKAEKGHIKKAKTSPKRYFKEIRGVKVEDYELGQEVTVDIFELGEIVDVSAISKGKGFQGVIKRHNFSRGPMTHGSHFHRRPGSLGTMRAKRVFKGKKLPGHMGRALITVQNLEIVVIDTENNLLLIKGNVPGPKKSLVVIKTAVKGTKKPGTPKELVTYIKEEEIKEDAPIETTEQVVEKEVIEEVKADTKQPEEIKEVKKETAKEKKEESSEA